jgi:hypothetical protein
MKKKNYKEISKKELIFGIIFIVLWMGFIINFYILIALDIWTLPLMGFFFLAAITFTFYWFGYDARHLKKAEGKYDLKTISNKLVTKELKISIRDCFFNKQMDVIEIQKKLKKDIANKFRYLKGFNPKFKSEEILELLYQILGFNNESEYKEWLSQNQ